MTRHLAAVLMVTMCAGAPSPVAHTSRVAMVEVTIDVNSGRRVINPLIYGTANATPEQLSELNVTWHRLGGNPTSRYNWRENASNRGADWFFESVPDRGDGPAGLTDGFVADARRAGVEPVVTVPMGEWIARLGPRRQRLASFPVSRFGAQARTDVQWFPDAGNGIAADGRQLLVSDPTLANVRVEPQFHADWIARMAASVRHYTIDNEPSLWFDTHRDVQPIGLTMRETNERILATAAVIKGADRDARVVAPEEWGWLGFHYSGADQQFAARHGWRHGLSDRDAHQGADYLPWLLEQWRAEWRRTGHRPVDVVSVHYYPQGGVFSDDVSAAAQARRLRSTRSLWDSTYVDESWINTPVALIPRLRAWVDRHYDPAVPIALTEYHWGADDHISGALAQADLWGIFGREGLDMAARWGTPRQGSPVFQVMKLFRNYDGNRSTFGDISVRADVSDPAGIGVYAAQRTSDDALTVVLVNRRTDPAQVHLRLAGVPGPYAKRYTVIEGHPLTSQPDTSLATGQPIRLSARSVTLLVVPGHTTQ